MDAGALGVERRGIWLAWRRRVRLRLGVALVAPTMARGWCVVGRAADQLTQMTIQGHDGPRDDDRDHDGLPIHEMPHPSADPI